MMLYTSCLDNATPIHFTTLPLHPPVMNTHTVAKASSNFPEQCLTRRPPLRSTYLSLCLSLYIYIYIYTYVHIYIEREAYAYIHIYIYIHTYIYIIVYIYIYLYIHIYIYICMYMCIYIYIYAYMYYGLWMLIVPTTPIRTPRPMAMPETVRRTNP